MHTVLKEILRNLKRHRGTAEWREPEREPAVGEVRGFRWEFPNGRKLTLMLDPPGRVLITKEAPDLSSEESLPSSVASNELEIMRGAYRWAAGAE